jgi:hypothetical protein
MEDRLLNVGVSKTALAIPTAMVNRGAREKKV